MEEHPNAAAVRAGMVAFLHGDDPGFAAVLAEDVVWHAPGTNRFSGRFEGKAAVLDRMRRMRAAGLGFSFEVHDVVGNDEHVIALVHLHARNAAGQRYDQQQVQVSHMRDRLVAEFWMMNQDQAVLDLIVGR